MTAATRFGPWLSASDALHRVASTIPRQNRLHYRTLSTPAILDMIALNDRARVIAETTDEIDAAEFALQELRAALQERRR